MLAVVTSYRLGISLVGEPDAGAHETGGASTTTWRRYAHPVLQWRPQQEMTRWRSSPTGASRARTWRPLAP